MVFEALRAWFDRNVPGSEAEDKLPLAAAALLVEVMRIDGRVEAAEREAVLAALQDSFSLPDERVHELLSLAEHEVETAADQFQFTRLINERFSVEEKSRLVEMLWRVAFADGRLDKHEEYVVRKLSELLHLPHRVFIQAKLRAQGE